MRVVFENAAGGVWQSQCLCHFNTAVKNEQCIFVKPPVELFCGRGGTFLWTVGSQRSKSRYFREDF
jgi:hypothetical protein